MTVALLHSNGQLRTERDGDTEKGCQKPAVQQKTTDDDDGTYCKANKALGMIIWNFSDITKEAILPLYKSLVRPHLEYCSQSWSPHYVSKIHQTNKRGTKMSLKLLKSVKDLHYDKKFNDTGF